jgi:hypothetical protein
MANWALSTSTYRQIPVNPIEFGVVPDPKTKGLGTGIMGPPHCAEARGMYRQRESRQG